MRCYYCDQPVLGAGPITVSGVGPAHSACHHESLVRQRVFKGLNIARLTDQELTELSDMVLMEKNVRSAGSGEPEIELFGECILA